MKTGFEERKEKYHSLSSRLSYVDNKELSSLLGDSGPARGWGATRTIKFGQSKVFVKRVPLTRLEYDNMYSAANLYNMPTFYNYGVGSAGFGAFRELIAHVKTTNWVLDGSAANFPLMYHYRLVPFTGKRAELNLERHQGYINYWNGDENIDRYIRDRNDGEYEMILCLEHFPDVLYSWLPENMDKSEQVIRAMRGALAFLRDHGVIHFDAHFGNIVLGDGIPYLTDFGLVLDKCFPMTAKEKAFFHRHKNYDDAEFLSCLGSCMYSIYERLPLTDKKAIMDRYDIGENPPHHEAIDRFMDNLEEIHRNRLLPLGDYYVAELVRNRDIIRATDEFFQGLRGNNRKNTRYPSGRIKRLFAEAAIAHVRGPHGPGPEGPG